MTNHVKLALIGIAALPLFAVGCSVGGGGGYHDHYSSRGYDYDSSRQAGYYDRNTRAADRSTGMTPREYRAHTYYNGGENGLAPENWGTTHSDRVEKSQERQYGY